MVVEVPVPVVTTFPGVLVIVQLPFGKLVKSTLPVAIVQVGCVIVPTVGAEGVVGWACITKFGVETETQPCGFVAVKLYVPAVNPEIVVV